jgi:signal transduction histidine kinase
MERLLAVVRLDKLTISRTALRPWMEDCITRFRNQNVLARLEINAPDIGWPMDARQMTRVLDNLVANALYHTPVDGWIRISAERQENHCYLVVEDSGPGVPEDLQDKIFEPFASFRSNGTGLGLAIAREIVEAHGGTIGCARGVSGARFEIRLPWRES